MTDQLAILIPVLGRPHRAAPVLASALHATPDALVLFVGSPGDDDERAAVLSAGGALLTVPWEPGPGDYARKINYGFEVATGRVPHTTYPLGDVAATVEWVFLGADDLVFRPGWYEACLRRHDATGACVVGTNDLGNSRTAGGQHSTHTLVNRDYWQCGTADEPGRILHEGYEHEYCNPPDAPIWMADGTFKPIGEIEVDDVVIGWERIAAEAARVGTPRRSLCYSYVESVGRRRSPLVLVTMESGRTFRCTPDHRWLNAAWSPSSRHDAEFVVPRVGRSLLHVVDEPAELEPWQSRDAGYVAGIYDGEGSGIVVASQSSIRNPDVIEDIHRALEVAAVDYSYRVGPSGMAEFVLRGGRQGYLDFLLRIEPARRDALLACILGWRSRNSSRLEREPIGARRFGRRDRIASVEALEGEHEVVSLTTSSGNYVAHGYASRNCDDELVHTAIWRGTYAHASDAVVEHLHPDWGKGVEDATYAKARAGRQHDTQLFRQRQLAYWGARELARKRR